MSNSKNNNLIMQIIYNISIFNHIFFDSTMVLTKKYIFYFILIAKLVSSEKILNQFSIQHDNLKFESKMVDYRFLCLKYICLSVLFFLNNI
jgi:hypothetical protein